MTAFYILADDNDKSFKSTVYRTLAMFDCRFPEKPGKISCQAILKGYFDRN